MVLFGRNILLMFVAIGAINWLDMARIVRGQALSLAGEFIEAAGVSGCARRRSSPATSCPTCSVSWPSRRSPFRGSSWWNLS